MEPEESRRFETVEINNFLFLSYNLKTFCGTIKMLTGASVPGMFERGKCSNGVCEVAS